MCFKAWIGTAVTEVISETFHKQNEASQKESTLMEEKIGQLLQKTNE